MFVRTLPVLPLKVRLNWPGPCLGQPHQCPKGDEVLPTSAGTSKLGAFQSVLSRVACDWFQIQMQDRGRTLSLNCDPLWSSGRHNPVKSLSELSKYRHLPQKLLRGTMVLRVIKQGLDTMELIRISFIAGLKIGLT